jgi:hypothetical protein
MMNEDYSLNKMLIDNSVGYFYLRVLNYLNLVWLIIGLVNHWMLYSVIWIGFWVGFGCFFLMRLNIPFSHWIFFAIENILRFSYLEY